MSEEISPIEEELRRGAELARIAETQIELEEVAVAIHSATCPILGCRHTYSDVDLADLTRAQYAINAIQRRRDTPRPGDLGR